MKLPAISANKTGGNPLSGTQNGGKTEYQSLKQNPIIFLSRSKQKRPRDKKKKDQ